MDSTPLHVCKNIRIPRLAKLSASRAITLITTLKKNMKAQAIDVFDKLLLRKSSINDQLKNIFDLEHSRHRSLLVNYLSNVVASLVAYSYQDLLLIYKRLIYCRLL